MHENSTGPAHPKNMNTQCAKVPQRAPTISSQVCAFGALSFSFAASCGDIISDVIYEKKTQKSVLDRRQRTWAKSKTWIVAPAPYHHGPDIPYL